MLSGPRFAHVGVLGLEDKSQNYEPAKPELKLSVIPALTLKLALNSKLHTENPNLPNLTGSLSGRRECNPYI